MERNTVTQIIQSVARALELLTAVSERGSLGVNEAARMIDVAPSTAHRLLATMESSGYVVQGDDRQYTPGPRIETRQVEERNARLVRLVRPFLHNLQKNVNETIHVMVLTGKEIRIVDGLESSELLRIALHIGSRAFAHSSAGGKAMLADMDPAALRKLYSDGVPRDVNGGKHTFDEVVKELAEVRGRRYGYNDKGEPPEVTAIGSSISSPITGVRAALSFAIPTSRFDPKRSSAIADTLIDTCELVRAELEREWSRGIHS